MVRRLLAVLALCWLSSTALAQEPLLDPTQKPDVSYRLFATTNLYTFLEVDTRDGRLWQVQWGDKEHRFRSVLNPTALVVGGAPGRFTLYPTRNIHTFLLLDQETGDTWHVQWGAPNDRFLARID